MMAFISGSEESYFSDDAYAAYVKRRPGILNARLRGEDETFIDALLSEAADFTRGEDGKVIVATLRGLEW